MIQNMSVGRSDQQIYNIFHKALPIMKGSLYYLVASLMVNNITFQYFNIIIVLKVTAKGDDKTPACVVT